MKYLDVIRNIGVNISVSPPLYLGTCDFSCFGTWTEIDFSGIH